MNICLSVEQEESSGTRCTDESQVALGVMKPEILDFEFCFASSLLRIPLLCWLVSLRY